MANLKRNIIVLVKEVKEGEVVTEGIIVILYYTIKMAKINSKKKT